jgi:hypothetical protein
VPAKDRSLAHDAGDSQNWQSRKASARQLWISFAESPGMEEETSEDAAARKTVTRSWDRLPETALCDTAPYNYFGNYLIHLKIPRGRTSGGEHHTVWTRLLPRSASSSIVRRKNSTPAAQVTRSISSRASIRAQTRIMHAGFED